MSKRLKFFLGHLSISAVIAVIVFALVFCVWYPSPMAKAMGVTHLIIMLLVIDVIIGPLFGWLVYKEGKKTLKFDLAVVILLQISAFSYGFYSVAKGRPVWLVYDAFAFHVVRQSDLEIVNLNQAFPEYQKPSWFKPQFVALDTSSKQKAMLAIPSNIIYYPKYYMDLAQAQTKLQSVAFPLSRLNKYNDPKAVKSILDKYPEADAWLGMSSIHENMVVLINKQKGKIIKIVDLRPYR